MERFGTAYTTNQATALRAHNAHIEAGVSGLFHSDFVLDMLEADHLITGKMKTVGCHTFIG